MAPEFFALDETGRATGQAGVPPDYFSETGQLWGNPLYDWAALEKDGFSWWIDRIRATLAQVDILRIDHFRGLESYWAVPAGAKTAAGGEWKPGPGSAFFEALEAALGEVPVIAEDLGIITEEVEALRRAHRLPGMKVLQFAFAEGAESYLPHRYTDPNCVAYTATHDNDTTRGWYAAEGPDYAHMDAEALRRERDKARRYLARDGSDIAWDLIRLVAGSTADTAIWPMQDVLDLGNDARMNRPGEAEGQWTWRMTPAELESVPAGRLAELSWLCERGPSPTGA
jgi:4-alpha-glucanotransferase